MVSTRLMTMATVRNPGAMRELRRRRPEAAGDRPDQLLDDDRLLPAIQAGAAGYLLKDGQPLELARAVRAAHAGEALLDPAVAARLVAAVAQAPAGGGTGLTARELEVLAHIGGGLSTSGSRALGISESTVKAHVGHVLAKLGVADRTQAALHAQRSGLV